MEAVRSSEMPVNVYQNTLLYILEDSSLHRNRLETLRSHKERSTVQFYSKVHLLHKHGYSILIMT